MDAEFWAGKKVFLTGHTGFKGSWLSLWLDQLGAKVFGFSLAPPTEKNMYELANINDLVDSTIGDIRDLEKLSNALHRAQPDIVIHMAAQSLVRHSYISPVETYATNVMGTVNILEAVRHTESVRAVVVVTSDKCYENREWVWGYRENESMGGFDPYSNSKGCAELVVSAYRSSFFNSKSQPKVRASVASARSGNVIGGGDWATDRLIPDMVRAIEAGQPVMIRSPNSIRPWQHVLEPLHGYLLLAQKLFEDGETYASGWNFGPHELDTKPVHWIADHVCKLWGSGASWALDKNIGPHEATYLKLDCSKAQSLLKWQPIWNLEEALINVVNWHQAASSEHACLQLTRKQIAEFASDSVNKRPSAR
jgi:CDP-glucose 4,6-dehydratase